MTSRILLLLRKDHYIFSGVNGISCLKRVYNSYKTFERLKQSMNSSRNAATGYSNAIFPFYLPHSIGFSTLVVGKNELRFVKNDIPVESCFAIKFEIDIKLPNDISILNKPVDVHNDFNTKSFRDTKPSLITDPNLYRGFINTHIITNEIVQRDLCFFVYGQDDRYVSENTLVDYITITDNITGLPLLDTKFNVEIASDAELGIDEDWDEIKMWSRTQS